VSALGTGVRRWRLEGSTRIAIGSTRRRWWRCRRGLVGRAAMDAVHVANATGRARRHRRRLDPIEPSSAVTEHWSTSTPMLRYCNRAGGPLNSDKGEFEPSRESRAVHAVEMKGIFIGDLFDVDSARRLLGRLAKFDVNSEALLRPTARENSHSWTLSNEYGLGAFPWHSDGAVSRNPPRYLAMLAIDVDPDATYTEMLDIVRNQELVKRVKSQVLSVEFPSGQRRYVRASETRKGARLYRWDPRSCQCQNMQLVDFIAALPATHRVNWTPGRVLVFDNWRFLHRRPGVEGLGKRLLWRGYAYQPRSAYVER
jgi:TfdA family taurine catabolism dioxygenase TauD